MVEDAGVQCDTAGEPSVEDSSEQDPDVVEASEAAGFDEPTVPTETGVSDAVVSEDSAEEIVAPSPGEENGAEIQESFQ